MVKRETPKKQCVKCERLLAINSNFYSADQVFFPDGRIHICKKCLADMVTSEDGIKSVLRLINKPFLVDMYLESPSGGDYLRQIQSLPQYKSLTYDDSEYAKKDTGSILTVEDQTGMNPSDIKKENIRDFGAGYKDSEYQYLSNFYNEYSSTFATDTPVQRNLYRNIAKIHLQAEKELSSGNAKAFKDLMELSSKLHNDGNIKPIQSTGANDDKGLSTYGLWIKMIEQEEPAEHFESKPLYEDYDKFREYIEKWLLRPMKNIFNISRDFDVKDVSPKKEGEEE